MSDLFCAATLVLARHGDTEYVEDWFSDEGGSLTPEGRAQAHVLADSLEQRRVASIFTSDTSRAVQTAEIVAARLRVGVTACKSLREERKVLDVPGESRHADHKRGRARPPPSASQPPPLRGETRSWRTSPTHRLFNKPWI